MSRFFTPNITRLGRIVRAIWGIGCIVGGVLLRSQSKWLCIVLLAAGVFALYEAVRGWCLMRACGIKTKL
jgi:Inner membrane protein YgaP-like, transmembrane domain